MKTSPSNRRPGAQTDMKTTITNEQNPDSEPWLRYFRHVTQMVRPISQGEPTPLTLRAFEASLKDEYLKENPEIAPAFYSEIFPPNSRLEEWREHLLTWCAEHKGRLMPLAVIRAAHEHLGADFLVHIQRHFRVIDPRVLFETGKVL